MPKLTLLLGRRVMQAYDFKQASIIVGRDEAADVVIDNPSVSRRHAEIRLEDSGWVVEDLQSSNGTYFKGQKIDSPVSIGLGDEIGFGKFSIIFGKALGEGEVPVAKPSPMVDKPPPSRAPTMGATEGTMHINPHEVKELLKDADRKKRAHFVWESGGQKGTHYLSDQPAVLIGTDDLCDIQVPKAPKHHVLLLTVEGGGCEVRYLAMFGSMTVRGRGTKRARLRNGDVVEASGLTLTFMDEVT